MFRRARPPAADATSSRTAADTARERSHADKRSWASMRDRLRQHRPEAQRFAEPSGAAPTDAPCAPHAKSSAEAGIDLAHSGEPTVEHTDNLESRSSGQDRVPGADPALAHAVRRALSDAETPQPEARQPKIEKPATSEDASMAGAPSLDEHKPHARSGANGHAPQPETERGFGHKQPARAHAARSESARAIRRFASGLCDLGRRLGGLGGPRPERRRACRDRRDGSPAGQPDAQLRYHHHPEERRRG